MTKIISILFFSIFCSGLYGQVTTGDGKSCEESIDTFENKGRKKMEEYMGTSRKTQSKKLDDLRNRLTQKREQLAGLSTSGSGVSGGRNTNIGGQASGMSSRRGRAESLKKEIKDLEKQVADQEALIRRNEENYISYQSQIDEEREFENEFKENFQWYSLAMEGYTEEEYQSKNAMYDLFLMALADVAKNHMECKPFTFSGKYLDKNVKGLSGWNGRFTGGNIKGGLYSNNFTYTASYPISLTMWKAASGAYLLAYLDYLKKYNADTGCSESRFAETRRKNECVNQLTTFCQGKDKRSICFKKYQKQLPTFCQSYTAADLASSDYEEQKESIVQASDLYEQLTIVTGSKEYMAKQYEDLIELVIEQAKKESKAKMDSVKVAMKEYVESREDEAGWWIAWIVSMSVLTIALGMIASFLLTAFGWWLFFPAMAAVIITSVGYYSFAMPRLKDAIEGMYKSYRQYQVTCNYDKAKTKFSLFQNPEIRKKVVESFPPKKRKYLEQAFNQLFPPSHASDSVGTSLADMSKKTGLLKFDPSVGGFKFFMNMEKSVMESMTYDVTKQSPQSDNNYYFILKDDTTTKDEDKTVEGVQITKEIESKYYKGVTHAEIRHQYFTNVSIAIKLANAQMDLATGLASSRLKTYRELLDKVDKRFRIDAKVVNDEEGVAVKKVSQNCMSKSSTGVVSPVPCSSCAGKCKNSFTMGTIKQSPQTAHLHAFDNYVSAKFSGASEEAQLGAYAEVSRQATAYRAKRDKDLESNPVAKSLAENFMDNSIVETAELHAASNLSGEGTYRAAMKSKGLLTEPKIGRFNFGRNSDKNQGEDKEGTEEVKEEKVVAKVAPKKVVAKKDDKAKKKKDEINLDMDLDLDFGDEGDFGDEALFDDLNFSDPKVRKKRIEENKVFLKKPVEEVVNKAPDSLWEIISETYQGRGVRVLGVGKP